MNATVPPTPITAASSAPNKRSDDELTNWGDQGPRPGRVGLWILMGAAIVLFAGWAAWRESDFTEHVALPLPEVSLPPLQQPLRSLWLEELSWTEIAQAQAAGYDTVLIATGGTEQNGPHLPTGKHNAIVRFAAHEIAARHGRTLLAPVLAYVPEQPHVNYPGTISLSPEVFQSVLEEASQSFLTQGFKYVILLGDSGGNQEPMRAAANSLKIRAQSGQRIVFLERYYAGHGQTQWLREQGFTAESLGSHAGVADTSEFLAIQPQALRNVEWLERTDLGHDGRPELATVGLGQVLLEMKISAALKQLNDEISR